MATVDTIVALASGTLPAGVAVVRISGPKSLEILRLVSGLLPAAQRIALRRILHPVSGAMLDHGLVVQFPAPGSFTGEDCAEVHLHGSPAGVRAFISAVLTLPDVRLAEAGEFTRRAFENGKLDLIEIEGLGDLLAAETESQRTMALSRYSGNLTARIEGWRTEIIFCMAEIEAQLDFSDEGDVSSLEREVLAERLDEISATLAEALASYHRGRVVRDGFRVGIGGAPNTGKSSLLNTLAQSDVAIVTDEAGTTRDLSEVAINLDGQLVVLVDSAGIRETSSKAEAEGVRRAQAMLVEADLVLWLVAPDVEEDQICPVSGPHVFKVHTKSDLVGFTGGTQLSSKTGEGIPALLALIKRQLDGSGIRSTDVGISHLRDQRAIETCRDAVISATKHLDRLEVAAEDLRQAAAALERLTGRVDAEQILDRLFSGFCIGK